MNTNPNRPCSFCLNMTNGTAIIKTVTGYVGRQPVCYRCAQVEPVAILATYEH